MTRRFAIGPTGGLLSLVPGRRQAARPIDVHDRICVRPPYFALSDLGQVDPGDVVARIPVESPAGPEAAPITTAEAGRHLAILGLCAAATVNPSRQRHFYLARHARVRWLPPRSPETSPHPLWGRAQGWMPTRRQAAARALLATATGVPLLLLDVKYEVLSVAAFTRLFAAGSGPERPAVAGPDPYGAPLTYTSVEYRPDRVVATFDIDARMCRGHFPEASLLPVAVLGGGMTGLVPAAAEVLLGRTGEGWAPRTVRLEARGSARVGQRVHLAMRCHDGPEHPTLRCDATVDGEHVAHGELTLSLDRR